MAFETSKQGDYLLGGNYFHKKLYPKFFLSCFSICTTSLSPHESSAYKIRFDVTTCWIILTKITNNRGLKMNPCCTPQEIFPKSESLFFMFKRNISSKRYSLNWSGLSQFYIKIFCTKAKLFVKWKCLKRWLHKVISYGIALEHLPQITQNKSKNETIIESIQ